MRISRAWDNKGDLSTVLGSFLLLFLLFPVQYSTSLNTCLTNLFSLGDQIVSQTWCSDVSMDFSCPTRSFNSISVANIDL